MRLKQNNKTILLGFSGGLDSTYVLWYLLKHTEFKVHAHHIAMQYTTSGTKDMPITPYRWEAERDSVVKINKYFHENNYRKYTFTEGIYNSPFKTIDIDIVLFMLAQVAVFLSGDVQIATGRVQEDDERWRSLGCHYPGTIARKIMNLSIKNSIKVMTIFRNGFVPPSIHSKTFCPAGEKNKTQIMSELPADLANLTWSCRHPLKNLGKFYECGQCHSCFIKTQAKK